MRVPILVSVLLLAVLGEGAADNSTCVANNADYNFAPCVARCLDNSDANGGLCYYKLAGFCKLSGAFDCEPTPIKCYFDMWGECLTRECTDENDRYAFVQSFQKECRRELSPITSISGVWGSYLTSIPAKSTDARTSSSTIISTSALLSSSSPSSTTESPSTSTLDSTRASSITQAPTTVPVLSLPTGDTTPTDEKRSLSTAALAGIVVGIIAGLAILISAVFIFMRRRKHQSASSTLEEQNASDAGLTDKAELSGADQRVELHSEHLKAELPGQYQHNAELHGETAVWELDASVPDGVQLHGEPVTAELHAGPTTPLDGDARAERQL